MSVAGFVLAAGEGRRLRPYTRERPKALAPFCGVPLLELTLARLAQLPLRGTVVNAWYLADQVEAAVARLRRSRGWDLRLSREKRLLDTGGGLRFGARLVPDAEHLFVHNADTVADADLAALLSRHLRSGAAATLLLAPGHGPRTVDVDADGRILDFRRRRGEGPYTFTGIHVLRRDVLDCLPEHEACSIIAAYEAVLAAGGDVRGVPLSDDVLWADLGTVADYIFAHGRAAAVALCHHAPLRAAVAEQTRRRAALARAGVLCRGSVGVPATLDVAPGTELRDVVVWDGVTAVSRGAFRFGVLTRRCAAPAPVAGMPDARVLEVIGASRESCVIEPLGRQGSGRRYARLRVGDRTWMWCAYGRDRDENASFARLSVFLADIGVRVPGLLAHLPDVGECLCEDVGGRDLRGAPSAVAGPWLCRAVEQAATLHVRGSAAAAADDLPLQPGFDASLYEWERDYFREYLLGMFPGAAGLWTAAVDDQWQSIRGRLLAASPVLLHRDLQSANVMLAGDDACLIDFQGLRWGAAAYDLGSLLYDPYRCWPAVLRMRAWRHYCRAVSGLGAAPPDDRLLHVAAVQRLLQALGAYGKLSRQDGLDGYARYVDPGLRMLAAAAAAADVTALQRLAQTCLARTQRERGRGADSG